MSKKKSRRAPSPMEQGELDDESPVDLTSPELRLEADDSHFTPEEEDERRTSEEDDEDEGRKDSPDRSEDDTLDIKPPQQNLGKREKHKKKHKEDRRREREKMRESERSKHAGKDVEKERTRDRRERDREREEFRQKEERRRFKSLKESGDSSSFNARERLERLERERHRIDRDRQRREQEHREQLRKQEREKREREKERQERAEKQRKKEEEKRRRERQKPDDRQARRDKERRGENRGDERIVQRSRSPYERERRDKERERYREREKERTRDKYDERQRKSRRGDSPIHEVKNEKPSNKDKARQRRVEYERQVETHQDDHHEQEYQEESMSEGGSAGDESIHSAAASDVASASGGSAETHTESEDSESDSASESANEHPEDDQERIPEYKRRSKFEDESEKESETESVQHSNEENNGDYLDETPPESPVELKPQLPPYFPAIQGCRPVDEFQCLNRIEEGTYGVVYRAVDKKTAEVVALKKLKMEKEKEGFPITSLREINTLLKAQHVNIVTVREIVVGSNMDKIFIVMDYVEHDLKSLMESMKEPFIIGEVKTLMIQLLRGVAHLHDNWIVHRDLKTSNLLLSHKGILKIGDFGLAREYGSPLKQYTPIVVTLWYRAPELLLGTKLYSTPIDMWSCGCIFAEFLTRKPLFPGKSEIDQLNRIFKELGTPNEKIWPGVSELPAMKKCTFADHPYNQLRNKFGTLITEKGFDLMNRFLTYNPERRISAEMALKHEYFQESPVPVDPSMFPTWPAKSEQPRRTHGNSPKPPSGGKAFSKLLGDDDHVAQSSGGFHLGTATKGASAAGAGFALKFGP